MYWFYLPHDSYIFCFHTLRHSSRLNAQLTALAFCWSLVRYPADALSLADCICMGVILYLRHYIPIHNCMCVVSSNIWYSTLGRAPVKMDRYSTDATVYTKIEFELLKLILTHKLFTFCKSCFDSRLWMSWIQLIYYSIEGSAPGRNYTDVHVSMLYHCKNYTRTKLQMDEIT